MPPLTNKDLDDLVLTCCRTYWKHMTENYGKAVQEFHERRKAAEDKLMELQRKELKDAARTDR